MLGKEPQKREFTEEYAQLEIKEVVSNKSKLLQLSPHLEKEVFIHAGGHIKNAAIPDTAKKQIILSALSQYVTQCDEIYFVRTEAGVLDTEFKNSNQENSKTMSSLQKDEKQTSCTTYGRST